jgi:hypothetical protein
MNNNIFCKNCGKSIADNVKFCASCGNAVSVLVTEVPKQAVVENNLKGLGGWLVLVILGLFVSVLFQVYGAYESVNMFIDGTVEFLSDPSSEVYIPGYGGLLKFEFIAEIIFLAAGTYLIYLFFKRSKKFPKYYAPFLIIVAIYVILDYAILSSVSVSGEVQQVIDDILSEQGGEIGRAVIGALIWGSYMKKSKRVKATFVEE